MPTPPSLAGLLLIGHGTRDSRGQAEFWATVELARARLPGQPVEGCYLELLSPDISAGIAALAARGVTEIVAAPVLLFSAGHAKQDIPRALATGGAKFPSIRIRQAEALEFHPAILELSAQRIREAVEESVDSASFIEETLLLMVSRGSSDPVAVEKLWRFAEHRRSWTPIRGITVGFVAMAQPTLTDALREAGVSAYRRVVVQPHILFHGEVLTEIQQAVAIRRQECPRIDWTLTAHLGPSPLLAEAILAQAGFQSGRDG